MSWKDMALGMRLILIWLIVASLGRLLVIIFNQFDPSFFLGFLIHYPTTIFIFLLFLSIDILSIIYIYKRSHWKLLLLLQGFKIIDFSVFAVVTLMTPLSELYLMLNLPLPASPEFVDTIGILTKLKSFIPIYLSLLIVIIIWIYFYKNRDYFSSYKR